jgi:hypothetical protein
MAQSTPDPERVPMPERRRPGRPKGRSPRDGRGGALYTRATETIERAIEAGSLDAATWYVDHVAKHRGIVLGQDASVELPAKLDEPGLIAFSERVTRQALEGGIGQRELKFIQEALAGHARIIGMRKLDELKAMLTELQAAQPAGGRARLQLNGQTPLWGRFRRKDGDTEDAEVVRGFTDDRGLLD